MRTHSNVDANNMMQHKVNMTKQPGVSFIYPEGQLILTIFWKENNCSVVGAIPSFLCSPHNKAACGTAPIDEHNYVRIGDGDSLTSKENGYWHYMFDMIVKSRLNCNLSMLVLNPGVEFLQRIEDY